MRSKCCAIGASIALAICAVLQVGCIRGSSIAGGDTSAAKSLPTEFSIKEKLLLAALATSAEPLKLERQITSRPEEGGVIILPISLAFSPEGGIYIADNNGHAIEYCPPDSDRVSVLPPQNGLGSLRAPTTIQLHQNTIFVKDSFGIKVFKRDGSFQRLMRVYYGVSHFAIAPDGVIYINPSFARSKAPEPLIVKLDNEGTRASRFGARINHPDHNGLDDTAYLFATSKQLIAAFECRPVIQIYDRAKEELVREFRIEHPIFGGLEPFANDPRFLHPRPGATALPRFVAGLRVIDERIFVLLHLPKPEVVEFDFEGREKGRYSGDGLPAAMAYFGFDVRRIGDNYRFSIGVIDVTNVSTIAEFTISTGR